MLIDKLDFNIPKNLIALYQKEPRDKSKLVVSQKNKFKIFSFEKIIDFLQPNDALIFNETKVLPAGIDGFVDGCKVSVNLNRLLQNKNKVIWSAFFKTSRKVKENDKLLFSKNFVAKVDAIKIYKGTKLFIISFSYTYSKFLTYLNQFGEAPLPPYIKKLRKPKKKDKNTYQSILAKNGGSVAAPTASLHFSNKLLKKIKKKGISIIKVTLHISAGTFIPIRERNINNHQMHEEYGYISARSAELVNKIKKKGGKIIAVGTTVLRLLEACKGHNGEVNPFKGETNIFIKPGWNINSIDGLITNFHTPKSTLLAIIFTMIGEKKTKELYKFAIRKKLRFFSYGDACLIFNNNE